MSELKLTEKGIDFIIKSDTKLGKAITESISGKNNEHIEIDFLFEEAEIAFQTELLNIKRRRSAIERELRDIEKDIHLKSPSNWIPELVKKRKALAMIDVEEDFLHKIGAEWLGL